MPLEKKSAVARRRKLAQRISDSEHAGWITDTESHVLRMHHGISEEPYVRLPQKKGAEDNIELRASLALLTQKAIDGVKRNRLN